MDNLHNSVCNIHRDGDCMLVLMDIDGVLADCSHRLHYLKDKEYDKFYSEDEMLCDKPIPEGLGLLEILRSDPFCMVVLLTGRPYRTEKYTREWLEENSYSPDIGKIDILMRKNHDFRPSNIVKVEILKNLDIDKVAGPVLFIDDDPKNVIAVEKSMENIQGILFGTSRLDLK